MRRMGHFLVKVTSRRATATVGAGRRTVCKNLLHPRYASSSPWLKVAPLTRFCGRSGAQERGNGKRIGENSWWIVSRKICLGWSGQNKHARESRKCSQSFGWSCSQRWSAITISWGITPCNSVEIYWCFGGMYCIHPQDLRVIQTSNQQQVSRA